MKSAAQCRSKARRARGASWQWPEASTRPPILAPAAPSLAASLAVSRCFAHPSSPANIFGVVLGGSQLQANHNCLQYSYYAGLDSRAAWDTGMLHALSGVLELRCILHAPGAASQSRRSAAADACGRQAPGGQQVPGVLDPCIPGGQCCMGDRRASRAQCSAGLLH